MKIQNKTQAKKNRSRLYISLVVILAATLGYLLIGNLSRGRHKHPNVLLITIDTLRADHLGCYGYRLETSPNIDKFAKSGVLFTDCTVQWPKTWPSMASMITGAYPKTTGMQGKRRFLPTSFNVMSEIFGEAGYITGAVISNFNIGKKFGFEQGFDHFVESWEDKWIEKWGNVPFKFRPGIIKKYTNATVVTNLALSWLKEIKGSSPFFLWLHYMDPHGPYIPPPDYKAFFKDTHGYEPVPLEKIHPYQIQERNDKPITDIGFYKAQYDREIRYLDDEIGRLLSELAKLGLETNTLIVFTADHGESLGDHDYYLDHGKLPYQACAHIPLILVQEDVLPSNRTFNHSVGLIDVSATVLDLSGIKVPVSFEGQSLSGLIVGEEEASVPGYVFMESGYHWSGFQKTVRCGRWKLINFKDGKKPHRKNGPEFELYHIYEDPSELNNIASKHPEIVKTLRRVLEEWYSSGPRFIEEGEEVDLDSLDERSREMLRSLGYIK
jgi:arylsulfatase A-like enzyme